MRTLQSKVASNWKRPQVEGDLKVAVIFTVSKSGTLVTLSEFKTSGNKEFDTAATDAVKNSMSEEFQKSFLSHVPLNRMGTPEDIANSVAFFASDDSAYITGSILEVSGGYHLGTPQYADFVGRKAVEDL